MLVKFSVLLLNTQSNIVNIIFHCPPKEVLYAHKYLRKTQFATPMKAFAKYTGKLAWASYVTWIQMI